jgi:Glycosyltransferase like family 2
MARGRYIWIAESDDFADLRFLERMVPILEDRPRVTMVYCRSWDVREDDEAHGFVDVYMERWNPDHWKTDFEVNGLDECQRFFVVATPVPNASSVLFRRDEYERAGGVEEDFRVSADYKLWAKMALAGRIAYVGEPLNYFRTHTENARTRTEPGGLAAAEYISVMLWVMSQVAKPGTLPKRAERVFDRPAAEMAPHERIRASIEAMSYIADWNLRYNPHVPRGAVRACFEQWRFALYEKEFALAPPSRWRFFRFKWEFYRYYFQDMGLKLRLMNLIRLLGAPVVGYAHRQWPDQAYERIARIFGR